MDKFEQAMQALDEWSAAKLEHDQASAEFHGPHGRVYSWDYFGYPYIEAMDEARNKAKSLLDEYVQEKVKEELGKVFGHPVVEVKNQD